LGGGLPLHQALNIWNDVPRNLRAPGLLPNHGVSPRASNATPKDVFQSFMCSQLAERVGKGDVVSQREKQGATQHVDQG
jgi:hypothetical protein